VGDRDGELAIAKFPHHADRISAVLWEAGALRLAAAAEINTATGRVERVAGRPVSLLRRFDREGTTRRPFLSAMSMPGAADHETRSYLEITDDHLRNRGFLYEGNRDWELSPAHDLNQIPVQFRPRILSTLIDERSAQASRYHRECLRHRSLSSDWRQLDQVTRLN
jgi:serine/threonine-protein kinase HipA